MIGATASILYVLWGLSDFAIRSPPASPKVSGSKSIQLSSGDPSCQKRNPAVTALIGRDF